MHIAIPWSSDTSLPSVPRGSVLPTLLVERRCTLPFAGHQNERLARLLDGVSSVPRRRETTMLGMSITDIITTIGVAVAALTFVVTVIQNRNDQTQQTAAQTREDLQAIIGACG